MWVDRWKAGCEPEFSWSCLPNWSTFEAVGDMVGATPVVMFIANAGRHNPERTPCTVSSLSRVPQKVAFPVPVVTRPPPTPNDVPP